MPNRLATSACARRISQVPYLDVYAFVIKKLFQHLGEKKFMFKKKDIAIAVALAMTVSQPVLGQGESGEISASSTAAPAASGPARQQCLKNQHKQLEAQQLAQLRAFQ